MLLFNLEKHFFIKEMMKKLEIKDELIILFGSYAKGNENKKSDIDIISSDEKIKNKIEEYGKTYNLNFHIQTIKKNEFISGINENEPLLKEIIKSHIILSDADFFVNVCWDYFSNKR